MSHMSKSILYGILCALISCLLLSALTALLQLIADLSDSLLGILSAVALGVSSYVAAYCSTQRCRSKGLMQGLICGGSIFIAVFILSMLFGKCEYSMLMVVKLAACLILGAIGGVKGINTKKTDR